MAQGMHAYTPLSQDSLSNKQFFYKLLFVLLWNVFIEFLPQYKHNPWSKVNAKEPPSSLDSHIYILPIC